MLRIVWAMLGAVLAALAAAGGYVAWGLWHVPEISKFELAPRGISPASGSPVRATFFGTSTLLFDDDSTQILIDGFFSRPALKQVFGGKVASDPAVVRGVLRKAGMSRLAAVVVTHSHYDHALDSALVATLTGAQIVGSASTANIARGGAVPEPQIRTPRTGEVLSFGAFRVTLLPSGHVPTGYPGGDIEAPLQQPARADAFKLGAAYAVLIEHGTRRLLVNASAGFSDRRSQGLPIDAVYLGVGQLGKREASYKEAYWQRLVADTGARHVSVIHWDNFTRPLDRPLEPIPTLLDDLAATLTFLNAKARASPHSVAVTLPQAWQSFDAFAP